MRNTLLVTAFLSATTVVLAAGCGDDGNTSSGTGGVRHDHGLRAAAAGAAPRRRAAARSGTTSAGGGGAGGGTGGTGGATGGTGGGTTTSGSTTTGGPVGDHLLISEIVVAPEVGEIIEIHNPTYADVSLADYYLSDNSTYPDLAAGGRGRRSRTTRAPISSRASRRAPCSPPADRSA